MSGIEGNNNPFLSKLRQIVLDNLSNEQFGVEDLASGYGLSRSQLHKKLKKSIGKSVSQFIREVRLDEGLKLLLEKDLTVSEVAYKVGFSSPTYFNTRFKDYFGYSPGEAKIRNRIGDLVETTNVDTAHTPSPPKNRKWAIWGFGISLLALAAIFFFKPKKSSKVLDQPLSQVDTAAMEKTIAVLPLKNWSGDPDLEYISDGMTDAIIIKLAKIGSIERVVPFTSIKAYKNTEKSIQQIAKELGVQNILQGSFQLAGEQVSIKLQMLDGKTESQFWGKEYQRTWRTHEVFDLQAAVAENVAETLNAEINESEYKLIQAIPTSQKEAYKTFWDAQYQIGKGTKLGFENGKKLFLKAIGLDSSFVEAYTELSSDLIYAGSIWGNLTQQEAWSQAKYYLTKAKKIEGLTKQQIEDIEGSLLTGALFYEWNFDRIKNEYMKTGIAPLVLLYMGKYESAHKVLQELKTDGKIFERTYWHWLAESSFYLGRKQKCLDILVETFRLYNDEFDWLRETSKYFYYLGEYDSSRQTLDRLTSLFPDRPPIVLWLNSVLLEIEGEKQESSRFLTLLEEKYHAGSSGSPAWFVALYHCHIGDYDMAFDWLRKSVDNHEVEMLWLHSEPLLRSVRDDPRYLELHRAVGFPVPPLEPAAFP